MVLQRLPIWREAVVENMHVRDEYYKLYQEIYARYSDDSESLRLPCILVGNKSDLHDDKQLVSLDEVVHYAQKNNMLFVQISAKDGGNIELLFEIAVRYAAVTGKIKSPTDSY